MTIEQLNLQRLLRPRVVITAVFVLFVLLVVSCDGPRGDLLPAPSPTASTQPQPTTSTVNYRQVPLVSVAGNTTIPPAITKGRSVIFGVVDTGDGLLVGATVRIEHLAGDQIQTTDVKTGDDGRFRLEGIAGGRYRVRGFLAPTHYVPEPEVFFLENGDEREVRLRVENIGGLAVRSSTSPPAPIVGQGVNLAVRVAQRTVDDDGVVRDTPMVGVRVSIRSSGWLEIEPDAVKITDGDGVVVFTFSCENVSNVTATAVVGVQSSPSTRDTTTTTNAGQPNPQEPANQQPPASEPILESLEVPPCAPVPTTTTASTATTNTTSTSAPPPGNGNDGGDN